MKFSKTFLLFAMSLVICYAPAAQKPDETMDRTALPIAEPKYEPIREIDARKAKAPPRFEVKAPAKAPNVVIVLIDICGFRRAHRPRSRAARAGDRRHGRTE